MVKSRRNKDIIKKTAKNKSAVSYDEIESEVENIENTFEDLQNEDKEYDVKSSKPLAQVKKSDSIFIDGKEYTVDAQYVLIDHGSTKEMAIELFDTINDKDFQLRYFDDQANSTIEFYELQEIMYVKKPFRKIAW